MLAHTEVQVAVGFSTLLETTLALDVGEVGVGEVGRTTNQLRQVGADGVEAVVGVLAGGQAFVVGAVAGEVGIPALGQLTTQLTLELSGFGGVLGAVVGQGGVPGVFGGGTGGLGKGGGGMSCSGKMSVTCFSGGLAATSASLAPSNSDRFSASAGGGSASGGRGVAWVMAQFVGPCRTTGAQP